jgi:ACR3 family arsenite efflux pump ArsB
VLAVNMLAVPVVVFGLSRFVIGDPGVLLGLLFVLLCPCVDYVIVFTGLAGGAKDRLLAATPLLMLAQMLLLPLCLWLFVGADGVGAIDPTPFVEAFVLLIVFPLVAAGLSQLASARTWWGPTVQKIAEGSMVPLMMATLAVVVASQIAAVGSRIGLLLPLIPIYLAFAAAMLPVGVLAGRWGRLDVPGQRAVAFSGVTRNSLVVLPLALALPTAFAIAPLVVVTQTLVELVVMVVFVRLVPRVVPEGGSDPGARPMNQ